MKTEIIKKILLFSKENKSIISTRQFGETATQFVGYILDFKENIFSMQQITTNGFKDGILIESIDNIETIECGEYERAYQFLHDNFDKIDKQTINNIELPQNENWKFELIKQLHLLNEIISIQLESDKNIIIGKIVNFDETHLEFNPLNNVGKDEGIVIYKLDNITTFTINELESRRIKLFSEWRKGEIKD